MNQLPRERRKPLILKKVLVEYIEIDQQNKTNISNKLWLKLCQAHVKVQFGFS